MGTILTTVLIAAPLAFMAGWLLSKAVFNHITVTRPNERPAEQQPAPTEAPAQPENEVLERLQNQLDVARADSQAAGSEISLLKEAVAEREHQLAEIHKQLQLAQAETPPEQDQAGVEAIQNVQQAKAARNIRQQLESKSRDVVSLKRQLIKAQTRLEQAKSRNKRWRIKVQPLAKQFRQQRLIISELRQELRQREIARKQEEQKDRRQAQARKAVSAQRNPPAEVKNTPTTTPTLIEQQLRDNLEELHGIGPALHRKLNAKGVFRLQQLASLNTAELTKLGKSVGVSLKLVRKHDWSSQAREKLDLNEAVTETA